MSFALLSWNFIDLLQYEYSTSKQTISIALINFTINIQFLFRRYEGYCGQNILLNCITIDIGLIQNKY